MAELFIELFSEENPAKLQIDARKKIIKPTEKMLLSMKKWFSSFNNDWKRLLEY